MHCRYQHAGIKRKPSIAVASSPASSASIKMFSLRSLRDMMASTSLALSRVAKDTPGLSSLVRTQTDITDILDPRIPYDGDSSSRRHLLSGDSEYSLAQSNLRRPRMSATASLPQLQRELDGLNRRSDRRMGGSFAIKLLPTSFNRISNNTLCNVNHFNYIVGTSTRCNPVTAACPTRARRQNVLQSAKYALHIPLSSFIFCFVTIFACARSEGASKICSATPESVGSNQRFCSCA